MLTQPSLTSSVVKSTVPNVLLSAPCSLTWRDRKLFVRAESFEDSLDLDALQNSDRLVECLKRSPVELVKLDSDLSPELLLWWAEACGQAKKACYLTIPQINGLDKSNKLFSSMINKPFQQITACVLLAFMSPIIIVGKIREVTSFDLDKRWAFDRSGRMVELFTTKEKIKKISSLYVTLLNVVSGNMLLSGDFSTSVQYLEDVST